MYQIIKQFNPDETDKSGEIKPDENVQREAHLDKPHNSEGEVKDESVIDKIKDALQDWSNDNEKDIEEDDNSALRSGL